MKRELLQNTKVLPYTSGGAVERPDFLSAVLGAKIGTAGELIVTVTHGDTEDAADVVKDKLVFAGESTTDGVLTLTDLAAEDVVNVDIDLLGLKIFVKITVSGTAAANTTLALALGDKYTQPV